jgi:shikimate dehydrogenase
VLDAVYDPLETRLLREAAASGARTVSGKWWLVHQAAAQLERWTGRAAPIDVMAAAFDA